MQQTVKSWSSDRKYILYNRGGDNVMKITKTDVYINPYMRVSVSINNGKDDTDGKYTRKFKSQYEITTLTFDTRCYVKIYPSKGLIAPGAESGKMSIAPAMMKVFLTALNKVAENIERAPNLYIGEGTSLNMDNDMANRCSKGFSLYDDRIYIRPGMLSNYEGKRHKGIIFWSSGGQAGALSLSEVPEFVGQMENLDMNVLPLLLGIINQNDETHERLDRMERKLDDILMALRGPSSSYVPFDKYR